jgi:outer membrane protein TolC
MDLMLGLPDSTQIEPEISSFSAPDQLMNMDDMIESALLHRNDKASLEQRKKAAGTDVKYARSGKYPSLSLTAGYIALNVPNLLTVTNAVNIGIGVQYNLSALWKNNAKVQKAQAREQQVTANEAMLNDNIKEEVQEAYFNYLLMKKKIDTYRQAVAQAEENYKIIKNKYDNSLATTTDLLDADIAQLQVKLDFAFSQADASTAYSKLLKSAGLLNTSLNIKE